MLRNILALGLAAVCVAAFTINTAAQAEEAGFHVTICHRTGSATNPYIEISPDAEGVVSGHLDHDQIGNGEGGDIIPVFVLHGVTYSKNLGITIGGVPGAAILANHCQMPTVTPTPTPPMRTPTPTPPPPGTTPTPPGPPPGTPPPPAPVPEPMTILLFGLGLAGVGFASRRFLK
jgi:hypothetical protein